MRDGWTDVDSYLVRIQALIEEHGWAVQGVLPTADDPDPGFGYTVGLTLKGLPEIIIFGLSAELMHSTLNQVAFHMVDHGPHHAGQVIDYLFGGGYDPIAVQVDPEHFDEEYLTVAGRMYGDLNLSALQLVIPDKEHRFPWDDGFSMSALPLLGPRPN